MMYLSQLYSLYGEELLQKINEQLFLVIYSVGVASLVGIPIGMFISRYRRYKAFVLSVVSVLWTIPSLALLALFIPFLGIGQKPALLVLTLYALLPIIRNTEIALSSISPAVLEAADGLGLTSWQRMRMVEIPLALPVIVVGVRMATAIGVGIATLAAFIGAGGLGDFINRGLATNNSELIMLGAIPSGLMALLLDFFIAYIEKVLVKRRRFHLKHVLIKSLIAIISLFAIIFAFYGVEKHSFFLNKRHSGEIIIASKNFTEQTILGEIMAQLIEEKTNLHVVRKFNLGTTAIVHEALVNKEIDLYPEYTGTAYLLILKRLYQNLSAEEIYKEVKSFYAQQYQLEWLEPYGFNNTQALAVKNVFAKEHHLQTISDLTEIKEALIIGAPAEFITRPDALPGLLNAYSIHFSQIISLSPALVYPAIFNDRVNIIMAFSTDGQIPTNHLQILDDDKHFFPPYYAAPVIRQAILKQYPELKKTLALLANSIDDHSMQQLNYAVDIGKKTPAQVARQFLVVKNFILSSHK